MGIELDVLVGHPEHDLLFLAFQVAEATGLKNAKSSVSNIRTTHKLGRQLATLVHDQCISLPVDSYGKALRSNVVMFSEPEVYRMLMSGRAPRSEPFRKWVTEEVLPTIRKTGKYNAEESTDPAVLRT
jgi:prophage antirepressor-like protein